MTPSEPGVGEPTLPDEDASYLASKGIQYSLEKVGNRFALVLKGIQVDTNYYELELQGGDSRPQDRVDVLVWIPLAYPMTKLDMWWVDPPLKVKASGSYPSRAEHFEEYIGRRWQRFSRHFPSWKVGTDRLASLMVHLLETLRRGQQ